MGGRLTLSFPEKGLRVLLAGVLALAGLKLLNVPGAQVIVILGLSTGVAALAIFVGRQIWFRLRRARNKASRPHHTPAETR